MGPLTVSNYVLAFIGSMGASAVVVPLLIYIAQKFQILSKVDFRRKNQKRTPLLGGVAIYISFITAALITQNPYAIKLALCGAFIAIVGILDDVWELPSQPKFIAQFITVALWIGLTPENGMMLEQIGMSRTMAFFFTGFWMIGIINAINFIDGMDGEATTTIVFALITMVVLSKGSDESLAAMALAGAALGFLLYNFNPAKIYLGDSGSTFLGFAASALASHIEAPTGGRALILVPLFIFAFPEVDAVLAIMRRVFSGTSIFKGDHEHLHHKLQKLGFSVNRSLMIIAALVSYCCFTAWFITQLKESYLIWSAALMSASAMLLVMGAVYYIYHRLATQVFGYSKTIMHKYISFHEKVHYDPKHFCAVSIDLLPYYKELQQRGLFVVDEFVKNFSDLLEDIFPNATFKLVGSYTILCIPRNKQGFTQQQEKIAHDFKRLLHHYDIVKTGDELPYGLNFYTDSLNLDEFYKIVSYQETKDSGSRLTNVG